MITNTYAPHVGGVARSVTSFTEEYRRLGHRVLVVAPEFENAPEREEGVVRVPAIQHFNGSDFSVALPVPGFLASEVKAFQPDIVHAHHPFLLGAAALRFSHLHGLPLVFTHHTMYEQYTHYVPGDSKPLKRFVIRLTTSYANLCNLVFSPSESIAAILRERGIKTPIEVVPTGIDSQKFASGNGAAFRAAAGIPLDAPLIGHLGRLAPEKNLVFLTDAVVEFMQRDPSAHFLVVGQGPSEQAIRQRFKNAGLADRLHVAGTLVHPDLANAYHAMDVFVFASKSETQGLVLAEAMAAGVPVVAVDASGVREVVADGSNGRLLAEEDTGAFADAIAWIATAVPDRQRLLQQGAIDTAASFSIDTCAQKALSCYERLLDQGNIEREAEFNLWDSTRRLIKTEWELLKGIAEAPSAAERRSSAHDNGQ